jgi:hypothetical protein
MKTLIPAVAIAFLPMQAAMASIINFDNWTLAPYGTETAYVNNFNVGPIFGSAASGLIVAFTNTVYTPGTPIPAENSGCVGLCSDFYFTSATELNMFSPSLNVVAGHDYAISFNIDLTSFVSSADYHVQVPTVQLTYLSNKFETALALLPNGPSKFSIDFVPSATGPIEFGLRLASGLNPNLAASSSVNSFGEGGLYLFSDLSVTDVSAAVPEPSTWAMMLLGFTGLGFLAHRRRRKADWQARCRVNIKQLQELT